MNRLRRLGEKQRTAIKQFGRSAFSATIFVTILSYAVIRWTVDSFWQDYLSNALATMVGILIGVPVSLLITSFQDLEAEKERKLKVIHRLREELDYNVVLIHEWVNTKQTDLRAAIQLHLDLKTEEWEAFSDGGELQWIKDPVLLGEISNAFFSINNFRRWSDPKYHQHFTPPRVLEELGKKGSIVLEASRIAFYSMDLALREY